jgi:hypothetical protein
MAIYASLTAAYAKAIYIDGTKRFSEIRPEYVEPVKAIRRRTLHLVTA